MTLAATSLEGYQPVGGALCLDFANTVDWHDSDSPVELLVDADCLAAWARIVGAGEPEVDEADLGCARALRDAIWQAFRAVLGGAAVPAGALAVLNRNLELAPVHRRLVPAAAGVAWAERPARPVDALLGRVARSAAEILADPGSLARVRMCAGEGCGWLFLDESRGARRRWCSMQGCGNRAKARAHYRRKAYLNQA